MSAKHALLGLLLEKPSYPYELGNRLHRRLGPAWRLNPGQLSQTISRLERDGHIETVRGSGERDERQVKAITSEGLEEFERWFDDDNAPLRPTRGPLLVKVTFAGRKRLRQCLGRIDAYERDRAEALAELAALRDSIDTQRRPVRADQVLLYLNLTAEIYGLEGQLRWAQEARDTVSWMLSNDLVWPSTREGLSGTNDTVSASRGAREELFGRMAAEPLRFVRNRPTQ
jgi:DNA-binding PadR family transcriptional regulator